MTNKSINDLLKGIKQVVEMEKMSGFFDVLEKKTSKVKQEENNSIKKLEEMVYKCQKCGLSKTRNNIVFGAGDLNAQLMFVGEAPGFDEDMQGKPFVGKAGKLLTKIIESIGLTREQVFIANILKCRPPGNRNPNLDEIENCFPYLFEQIDIIKPKIICALGKFAAQTLLNSHVPISRLRGKFYDYRGIKLMPTYHPAYLLRNSSGKKDVWQDMKAIAKFLGISMLKK